MALNKVFHKAPKDYHYICHYAYPVGQGPFGRVSKDDDGPNHSCQTRRKRRDGKGEKENEKEKV